jgi:hypothetical protein
LIKLRRMRWAGLVARWGRFETVRGFVAKSEGKSANGRPSRRWEDIKMDLQEVECGDIDGMELAQDKDS